MEIKSTKAAESFGVEIVEILCSVRLERLQGCFSFLVTDQPFQRMKVLLAAKMVGLDNLG